MLSFAMMVSADWNESVVGHTRFYGVLEIPEETLVAQSVPVLDNVLNIAVERYLRHAGDLFVFEGDYESALDLINKTLEIEPEDLRALNLKGDILYCLNRDMEALDVFNRILKVNPAAIETLLSKSCTLEVLGKAREALSCCRTALVLTLGKAHYLLPNLFEQAISLSLSLRKYHEAGYFLQEASRRLGSTESQQLQSTYKGILSQRSQTREKLKRRAAYTALRVLP